MTLIKGKQKIKIKEQKSSIKGFNYTYLIIEHKRAYTCQTTPKMVKLLGRLENRGFKVE